MFLDDEQAYQRLRRHETTMGWLAITAVAALVFMFAGLMNAASASGPRAPLSAVRIDSARSAPPVPQPEIITSGKGY